jgi:hypothetical protein
LIRKNIRNLKNYLNDILRKLNLRKTLITNLKYRVYKTKYKHTFFGYYDKTPFSNDNKKLLAISTNYDDILSESKEAIVGYFNLDDGSFIEIDKTTTWCWQQGCRLMWFDNNSIIYNKIVDNDYGSVVYDIKQQKQIKQFNFAIYDKSNDNKYALSLNFSRLQYFRPGYGYCNFLKEEDKEKVLESDGIFLCNLTNNSKKLLISLKNIILLEADDTFEDANHYINHLKFSPDDKTFIFYHIWDKDDKRYTRAILANINGDILKIMNNNSFMSHYSFKNNNELLIYTKTKQEGYHLYDLNNNTIKIACEELQEDGHPTFIEKDLILTDTYPDRLLKEQKLIIMKKDRFKIIGKFYSPSNYIKEFRCDLHPRISNDTKNISIDIPTFQGRKMLVLEFDKNEIN